MPLILEAIENPGKRRRYNRVSIQAFAFAFRRFRALDGRPAYLYSGPAI